MSRYLDYEAIICDCYDPTQNALRVTTTGSDIAYGGVEDWEQAFEGAFFQGCHCLRISEIGVAATGGTMLDHKQVVKKVFDNTNSRIRTVT